MHAERNRDDIKVEERRRDDRTVEERPIETI